MSRGWRGGAARLATIATMATRLRPGTLLLLACLLVPTVARADGPEPPTVRWKRSPRVLTLDVAVPPGSHVAPDLPVRAVADDGTFQVDWKVEPEGEQTELRVQVPVVPDRSGGDWQIVITGGVCSDDGAQCVPWHAGGTIARRGPARGAWQGERGRPPAGGGSTTRGITAGAGTANPGITAGASTAPKASGAEPGQEPAPLPWIHAEEGGAAAALQAAEASGRPVLADLYAVWCPPCDRLRDEFLLDPRRRALLERFTLLKLDADDPSSFAFKDRYSVGGYPTVLILDAKGEVLDRIVGYGGPDAFGERLEAIAEPATDPRATAFAAAARRLAEEDAAAAWQILEPTLGQGAPATWAEARIAQEAADAAEPERRAALATLAADLAPDLARRAALSAAALEARTEAGEDTTEARAELRVELLQAVNAAGEVRWTAGRGDLQAIGEVPRLDPSLLEQTAEALYVAASLGDGGEALLVEAALRVAAARILATPGSQRTDGTDGLLFVALPQALDAATLRAQEGGVHDVASLLEAAGLLEVSLPILQAMTELHPDSFTWHHRVAGNRLRAGDLAAADAAERRALAASYGDNALRAALRLAEILVASERAPEATAVIDAALAQPAPAQTDVRTHRYRQKLQELRDGTAPPAP